MKNYRTWKSIYFNTAIKLKQLLHMTLFLILDSLHKPVYYFNVTDICVMWGIHCPGRVTIIIIKCFLHKLTTSFPGQPLKKSGSLMGSLRNDCSRFWRSPVGGSLVILTPFWRTVTGNCGTDRKKTNEWQISRFQVRTSSFVYAWATLSVFWTLLQISCTTIQVFV